MGEIHQALSDELISFIGEQHVFFTATAPEDGRINLSPKGIDTFRCVDKNTVAYLDLTGSGNEASAHLTENGRMTIMFCSFGRKPLILRLYGKGSVILRGDARWDELIELFDCTPGMRQIILLSVDSLQTSCGYGVPELELKATRSTLQKWAENKGEAGVKEYWKEQNQVSIDGLPARPLTE